MKDKDNDSVIITVKGYKEVRLIRGQCLFDALISEDIPISSVCSKGRKCGKCKVRILKGDKSVSKTDFDLLSKEELDNDIRLACALYPLEDTEIEIVNEDEEILACDEIEFSEEDFTDAPVHDDKEGCGIAIDIGSTTIAGCIVDLSQEQLIASNTRVNSQRKYGADVVSRIAASNAGKGALLQEAVRSDIMEMIFYLISKAKVIKSQVKKIVISANTTMTHLLLGFSCEGLGLYPFNPVNISLMSYEARYVIPKAGLRCQVYFIPGVSAYVGADIVSGLYFCDYDKKEAINLFVDMGTNGEIAIGNKDRILATSVAAGPAFEGGNLSCGMASVAGAISHASINEDGEIFLRTIANKLPKGICGTGAVEITAELLEANRVDKSGKFVDPGDDPIILEKDILGNPIAFTQNDIRQIQMAKGALRAGIEILIKRYGIKAEDIDNLYLAGGFGYEMNVDKAIRIGMFEAGYKDKVVPLSNSSLFGAVKFLLARAAAEDVCKIVDVTEDIPLAADDDFNEKFISYIDF